MLVSAPELVACEVTTSDTTGWTVVARTVELVSVPGLVAIKGVLIQYGKHWELFWAKLGWYLQDG